MGTTNCIDNASGMYRVPYPILFTSANYGFSKAIKIGAAMCLLTILPPIFIIGGVPVKPNSPTAAVTDIESSRVVLATEVNEEN